MKQIRISDATMKQSSEGFSLSFKEKIELAKLLDAVATLRTKFLAPLVGGHIVSGGYVILRPSVSDLALDAEQRRLLLYPRGIIVGMPLTHVIINKSDFHNN
jgi:hypothetical protein